ncbi:MAG: DNA replication/repair protein RecF [Ruminococcaceae bacterium]|nr:DNA replication/repair protein RecF [Oscillospiraceae bacterium]
MYITRLELDSFRNISSETIHFGSGINVICGKNAQGKTNIAEAVYYLACAKSFRGAAPKEMVYFGNGEHPKADRAKIEVTVIQGDGRDEDISRRKERTIKAELFRNEKKKLYINDVKIEKYSEFFGKLKVVLFTPEHLRLVKDGPSERRSFIDQAISQLKPQYASMLSDYGKKLMSRNALLKKYKNSDSDRGELFYWDDAVAASSAAITVLRAKYIDMISEKASELYGGISGGEEMRIAYRSSLFTPEEDHIINTKEGNAELKKRCIAALEKRTEHDIFTGSTSVGAHRDDFDIFVNGKSARDFASQGQQRSCVLALKLAEGEAARSVGGEYPVFIFDDVFSELDSSRREFLTRRLSDKQIIITSCETEDIKKAAANAGGRDPDIIRIDNGSVING